MAGQLKKFCIVARLIACLCEEAKREHKPFASLGKGECRAMYIFFTNFELYTYD